MTVQIPAKNFAQEISSRGFMPLYYTGESNYCPGCGGRHWHVGRISAQCARCDTALPIAMNGIGEFEFDGEILAA